MKNRMLSHFKTANPLIKTISISLCIFVLIAIAGLGFLAAYRQQMHKIEIGCGLGYTADTSWTAYCTREYARHHMGIRVWGGPLFIVGATGTAVTLIWLGVATVVYKKPSVKSNTQ